MTTKRWIDLRSDTVTRPTDGMRRAMSVAEVGDDVYGEDPSVRALEERAASLLGFDSGLFVPSGTMANQIAIHLHAPRGSDVLLEEGTHVYLYELGAMAAWSGVMPRPVPGDEGLPDEARIDAMLPPRADVDLRATLLILENTHNHAGGVPVSPERQAPLIKRAREAGLRLHLDGARIFNAATALNLQADRLTSGFDSAMFCLSKGLGAPVGSVLLGSAAMIEESRTVRKRMGGGMRQAGILAAAGSYALEHHRQRLAQDHDRARRLALAVAEHPWFDLDPERVRTNIVIAEVREGIDDAELLAALRQARILAGTMGPGRLRFATHLDIDESDLDHVVATLANLGAR